MRLLVTGTAGYVGSLLAERLLGEPDVAHVVATDRRPRHEASIPPSPKLTAVQGRLEERRFVEGWAELGPFDAVIHAAFGVRAGYGRRATEVERANIEGCRNVFDFCFRSGVKRLIYFSSAAVYGARPGNTLDHFFAEDEPLREETYPYGAQKRESELLLRRMHQQAGAETRVAIVRPCSITGPRFLAEPTKKITLVAFLTRMLPLIPEVSREWSRQYIHEEDLYRATKLLLRADGVPAFDSFNLAPHDYLTARDIANALGKRTVRVPAWLVDKAMFVLWHGTRGRVPTPRGSIEFYKYPINLDGRKITRLGFEYSYSSRECLLTV
jgi:UDP-glucose 4-epimerase